MEKRAEDEKDVYDITLNYIARGSYPQDATKQGRDRTLGKIAQKYFWPGISKDVRIWVQHCDQCQKTKRKFHHPAEELHPVPVPNSSWKQIGIDRIGPLPTTTNGNKYVIVVTDYFLKWPEARASPTKEAINVTEFLNDLILRHGCPDVAISDQGTEFCNQVANHLLKLTGTEHRVASAYHPQTNGLTERFNQTLKGSLIQVVNEKQNWDDHIEKVMFSYRTSIHASTGYAPFFLMHFREAKLPVHVQVESVVGGSSLPQILTELEHLKHIEALINLQEQYRAKATQNILCAQTRQKLHYDKKHNTNSIFKNAELDLQHEEYALSKDIDVSL
ncbi:hypothetical protein EMCRGX_G009309 [Ephydatia muelleri]